MPGDASSSMPRELSRSPEYHQGYFDGTQAAHKLFGWAPSSSEAVTDAARDIDFAVAMRVVQLIVTMPEGREHTSVPCSDLRTLARVLTAQQARIVELEEAAAEEWRAAESAARFRAGKDGNYDAVTTPAGLHHDAEGEK